MPDYRRAGAALLCAVHGLEVVALHRQQSYHAQGRLHWIGRVSPVKARKRFFANRIGWHASLGLGYVLGSLCHRVFGPPGKCDPIDVLLVARKP